MPITQQQENYMETSPELGNPVAWAGYDLDGMVEAFNRAIESHAHSNSPFHNPVDADARMALRILRGIVPAMKRYAAPQAQQPRKAVKLTPEEVAAIVKEAAKGGPLRRDGSTSERIARAIEQAVWEKLGVTE